jgi:hypothetical protein
LQLAEVANLTTGVIMNVTYTFACNFDQLLELLDLELVDAEDDDVFYDAEGIAWYYDEEMEALFYYDEDLEDWAEVDEDGVAWCVDDETGIVYYFDEESDDWVEYEDSEEDESENDASAW